MDEVIKKIFDLSNRVAVITGGSGHLGRAMVRALLSYNAQVIVAGRSEEKFKKVFLEEERKFLKFTKIDILSSESINTCLNMVYRDFGHIDILINNAAISRGRSQENMTDDDWSYTMEAVLGSIHKTIRTVIPIMKSQNSGKIINITSMYGIVGPDFDILYKGNDCEKYTNPPHYGAAKAAVIQLTKYYAILLGKSNIQVNAISPGPFPNPMIQKENPAFIERLKNKNPLHKIGTPEDLNGVTLLLSSNSSNFITGQTIQVDGGWTIW